MELQMNVNEISARVTDVPIRIYNAIGRSAGIRLSENICLRIEKDGPEGRDVRPIPVTWDGV